MATLLIGVREGLEATLIVSIVAAFLRRNGRSIRPMLIGVGLAVGLSAVVGVCLDVLSTSLPQRQQEMLETVIGAIAVVFVTTMILWMNRNAARLKGELESQAAQALHTGGSFALALMAFLAVLKEGFETAVFLLAAAQATRGSGWTALLGAVTGIIAAVGIGFAIYVGGLKLNLGRFFRVTGVFLVFIASGLVLSTLRTAHEAGWITIGQQKVLDFSSWMPARSILGSLITGMFGIPSDPRLIEVLGWLLYAVPVLVVFLWPQRVAATPQVRRRVLAVASAALAGTAVVLAIAVPMPGPPGPTRTVTLSKGGTATVTLTSHGNSYALSVNGESPIPLAAAGIQSVNGLDTQLWQAKVPTDPGLTTGPYSLAQLVALTGGRLPVGLHSAQTPGPFQARWTATTSYSVAVHGNSLVGGDAQSNRVAVLQGGGLPAPKTVSAGGLGTDWTTDSADDQSIAASINHLAADRAEHMLWRAWLPILLAAGAVVTAVLALRAGHRTPTNEERHHTHGQHASTGPIGIT